MCLSSVTWTHLSIIVFFQITPNKKLHIFFRSSILWDPTAKKDQLNSLCKIWKHGQMVFYVDSNKDIQLLNSEWMLIQIIKLSHFK